MAYDNRLGPPAREIYFDRPVRTSWPGTHSIPQNRRLDDRDVRNVLENLRTGIPDWQRDDARQVIQMMRTSPRSFQQDHCQRMISQLARNVENRYCRPDHGWQAHHHNQTMYRFPPYRQAEFREMAQMARDNERSARRALNVGLGIAALGSLAAIIREVA